MINQLLVFKPINNIFLYHPKFLIGFLLVGIDSILYANLKSFFNSHIKFYLLHHTHSMLQKTPKTCNEKWYKTKTRRGNVAPFFSKSLFGITRIQTHMFMSKPIINLSTYPIPSYLLVQSVCYLFVIITTILFRLFRRKTCSK